MEWQIEAYMWDELAFNCDILQGGGGGRVFCVFQTVFHYFKNMKSKLTPLLTIINVPGLFEYYSSVHIILKRRKKSLFCYRCGLLGNAYAPPRRFVVYVCWQLDFESTVGHFLILHFSAKNEMVIMPFRTKSGQKQKSILVHSRSSKPLPWKVWAGKRILSGSFLLFSPLKSENINTLANSFTVEIEF